MDCPLTSSIVGLIGVLVGGLIGHWLAVGLDKQNRRRAFDGFVSQWRAEVINPKPTTGGFGIGSGNPTVVAYKAKASEFHSELALAKGLFKDSEAFHRLTSRLAGMQEQDWKGKDPKDVILPAFDELVAFLA